MWFNLRCVISVRRLGCFRIKGKLGTVCGFKKVKHSLSKFPDTIFSEKSTFYFHSGNVTETRFLICWFQNSSGFVSRGVMSTKRQNVTVKRKFTAKSDFRLPVFCFLSGTTRRTRSGRMWWWTLKWNQKLWKVHLLIIGQVWQKASSGSPGHRICWVLLPWSCNLRKRPFSQRFNEFLPITWS